MLAWWRHSARPLESHNDGWEHMAVSVFLLNSVMFSQIPKKGEKKKKMQSSWWKEGSVW
jgi:hypothetical protein